jgi:hypothetical protein
MTLVDTLLDRLGRAALYVGDALGAPPGGR